MTEIKHNDLEEAIRLAEIGEYLYNRSYTYGNGYDEPREFGIEWQWQQSKPNEFGQGALLAEAVKWHSDMAEDGINTEATKLRASLDKNAKALEHWRQEVGKLHSQIASHTSALAERDAEIESIRAQLVRMVDIAEGRLFEIERIRGALGKLEGDSQDAMIEVIGEGPEFKRYNQGKSSMREWFLHRVRAALAKEQADG